MMMTRTGVLRRLYGEKVEARPFSRFTAVPSERAANREWRMRATTWGETHVNEYGHYHD